MFETYRMLGRQREAELLAEADRLRARAEHRNGPSLRVTFFVVAIVVVAALLVWAGTTTAVT
jgi:hypothetical protein